MSQVQGAWYVHVLDGFVFIYLIKIFVGCMVYVSFKIMITE